VFGTNLIVDNINKADSLVMGTSHVREPLTIAVSNTGITSDYTKPIGWFPHNADETTRYDWVDTVGVKVC
jgi:hypothetical protein